MNPTRRRVLAAFGGGAAALATAACSGTLPRIRLDADATGRARGTVRFWYRAGTQRSVAAMIAAFHRSQDRIRVQATPVVDGQYVTKLATTIRSGHVPDLVDMDDINSTLFVYRDAFADLTDPLAALPFRTRLSPGHLRLGARDGRQYAVPFFADNSALACNTELFERAGLDIDESTRDFAGLLRAARAISRLGDDTYGWYLPGNGSGALAFTVLPQVWASGGRLIRGAVGNQRARVAGNDGLRATLTLLSTMWREKLIPRTCFSDDGARWTGEFLSGRIGMLPCSYGNIVGSADAKALARVRYVLLPGRHGGRSFFDGGDNFAIPNGAQNPDAAWQFVAFCLGVARQQTLPRANYLPVRADALTDDYRRRYPLTVPPLADIAVGYAPPCLAYNLIFNQANSPWLAMVRRAVFGGDVTGAMAEGQRGYDTLLRQAQL